MYVLLGKVRLVIGDFHKLVNEYDHVNPSWLSVHVQVMYPGVPREVPVFLNYPSWLYF
jgi:hypothetical protein